jgi:acyl phosphate:glycerol-3-phosphate acyltransferase
MNPTFAAAFAASFLIGAIPFAKLAMIGTGIDITKVGSKNPGFNNVRRVVGWPRAAIPLFGDILKGSGAVLLFSSLAHSPALLWSIGVAAIMGHCWSPLLGWNGGKGVATMAGVLLALEWRITLPCLLLYPTLRWFGRRMGWKQEGAISSMTTMLVISILVLILRGPQAGVPALVMFGIVVLRHVPNIREIVGG